MDADKRHQLKTNELADALAKLRTFGADPQTRWWLLGLAAVVVLVVGYRVWAGLRETRAASGWQELDQVARRMQTDRAGAIDELRTLASNAPNQTLAAAARLRLANALRSEAASNPQRREQLLAESVETLKALADDPSAAPSLAAAAIFSLATSYESLHNLDAAKAAYERIMQGAPFAGSPFHALATQRLATLDDLRAPTVFVPGLPPSAQPPPPSTAPVGTQPAPPTASIPSADDLPAAPVTTQPAPGSPGTTP